MKSQQLATLRTSQELLRLNINQQVIHSGEKIFVQQKPVKNIPDIYSIGMGTMTNVKLNKWNTLVD